jgi:hypothetical protein
LYSFLPDVFLGLDPEHFATLRMFCSPSSGDYKLSSHPNMHSEYDRGHGACLLPTGRSTLSFLFHDCFCLETPCFRSLPRPFFHILWLSDFVLCGYPHCETFTFACLLCRLLVNVPFCCCMRLLHRRICLLLPLVLILS